MRRILFQIADPNSQGAAIDQPIVRIEGLHYAYPPLIPGQEPVTALRGIDLEIGQGEFVVIMGPTGAGKTTLCLALNGIVPHLTGGTFGGRVVVAGLDTRRQSVAQLSRCVGLVFQDAESQLFNMTVEEEVAFGPESLGVPPAEIAARVDWALGVVRMERYRARSPFQLSGGQQQRVAIAAVLAMRPQLLVMDEPTGGLDPVGKREVFAVVEELRRGGMTIVMAEAEAERAAEFADRIVVLHRGNVALQGPPREVFAQVDRLWGLGVDVPQVSELAHLLNERQGTSFYPLTLEEARCDLAQYLRGEGRG